jgi:hypothetical protein
MLSIANKPIMLNVDMLSYVVLNVVAPDKALIHLAIMYGYLSNDCKKFVSSLVNSSSLGPNVIKLFCPSFTNFRNKL